MKQVYELESLIIIFTDQFLYFSYLTLSFSDWLKLVAVYLNWVNWKTFIYWHRTFFKIYKSTFFFHELS